MEPFIPHNSSFILSKTFSLPLPAFGKHALWLRQMTDIKIQTGSRVRWRRALQRLLLVVLLAFVIGAVLNRLSASFDRSSRPAGFTRGVLQGALMPMSLPNLLVGRNVTIYSQNNTGVSYKLGYTTGVNTCGAIFFGLLFWRLSRWRRTKNGG